jgi:hypothetical protein
MIPAPRNNPDFNSHEWQDWFFQLWKNLGGSSGGSMDLISRPPTLIENYFSTNGWTPAVLDMTKVGAKQQNSGSLLANTPKDILTLTGPGVLSFLAFQVNPATAGYTIKTTLKLTIDGVVVFNSFNSIAAPWAANQGANLVGSAITYPVFDSIAFNTSCVVTLTEDAAGINDFSCYYVWRTV